MTSRTRTAQLISKWDVCACAHRCRLYGHVGCERLATDLQDTAQLVLGRLLGRDLRGGHDLPLFIRDDSVSGIPARLT
jgi:hypothetical protein